MGDVDVLGVARARPISGHIDLARRQREPADCRGQRAAAPTEADGQAELRPAHPGHQGRRVDRPRHALAGRPAPGVAHVHPAAVVERREAPGRVVHPGPAPRAHPGPVARVVGGPAHGHVARNPERAVFGALLPVAVPVQLCSAGHFGRHIAHRCTALAGAIALVVPGGEGIVRGRADAVLRHVVLVDEELGALAGLHVHATALSVEVGLTTGHGDDAGARAQIDAVAPGALHQKPAIAGADVDAAGLGGVAHAHGHTATQQLQRDVVVIEQGDVDFGAAVEPQRGRADLQFGACAGVGSEAVARGQRQVATGADPLVGVGAVQPDLALHIGQAGHAARRVGLHRLSPGVKRPGTGEQHRRGQRKRSREAESGSKH